MLVRILGRRDDPRTRLVQHRQRSLGQLERRLDPGLLRRRLAHLAVHRRHVGRFSRNTHRLRRHAAKLLRTAAAISESQATAGSHAVHFLKTMESAPSKLWDRENLRQRQPSAGTTPRSAIGVSRHVKDCPKSPFYPIRQPLSPQEWTCCTLSRFLPVGITMFGSGWALCPNRCGTVSITCRLTAFAFYLLCIPRWRPSCDPEQDRFDYDCLHAVWREHLYRPD